MTRLPFAQWAKPLRWIDRRPLLSVIEPYRLRNFEAFLGSGQYNVGVFGRAKKNWKSADAMIAGLRAVGEDWAAGSQVYVLANDKDQARDDLVLLEKIVRANPLLSDRLRIKRNLIERKDGRGFVEVLPAQDVAGTHGKTFRMVIFDEIHAYRTWDLFEALAFDPTRPEAQWWITSYASLFHRPGAPLFDLLQQAKAGSDPRMLFDWWAADFCTAPDVAQLTPEQRANPSMASWGNDGYLTQQQRRLPAHKYRRLHLNLSGLPAGSAFVAESVMDAIVRGAALTPEPGSKWFVDMSGGSSDDAVLGRGHQDAAGRFVVTMLMDQGQRPPFSPATAVKRFVRVMHAEGGTSVTGDKYAGETFKALFEEHGISYRVCQQTKSELYESLEPLLNAHQVVLPDVPQLEQQLLGLCWRGGKIDHPAGEHDDYSNAASGVVHLLAHVERSTELDILMPGGTWAIGDRQKDLGELLEDVDRELREAGYDGLDLPDDDEEVEA